jgi:hypothetical protein
MSRCMPRASRYPLPTRGGYNILRSARFIIAMMIVESSSDILEPQ